MRIPLALFVEHDLIDYVNAASTVVIAAFTAMMYWVVKNQLRASKDIERAWLMVTLSHNFSGLQTNSSQQGSTTRDTAQANARLTFTNRGNGPVWVKHLRARLVILDSVEKLPKKPELNEDDDQHWCPPPFVDSEEISIQCRADGLVTDGEEAVLYGRVTYLDKFQQERFSTFGYAFQSAGQRKIKRLWSHHEYNRNT